MYYDIESLIPSKVMIAKEIYSNESSIGINTIEHCTLTTIVENVNIPHSITRNGETKYSKKKIPL